MGFEKQTGIRSVALVINCPHCGVLITASYEINNFKNGEKQPLVRCFENVRYHEEGKPFPEMKEYTEAAGMTNNNNHGL